MKIGQNNLRINANLLEDIFEAYFEARKNKRNTLNALAFEINYESKLFQLYEDIKNDLYKISNSICFINFSPIKREIFAADFRDRIVHHLVFRYINPLFEKTFIHDSYSCRKGKGTHYGIKRINRFISQCSKNYTQDCYIMKLDVEGYFMQMDREILHQKVKSVLERNKEKVNFNYKIVRSLIKQIIFNDPVNNCRLKGKTSDWHGLPKTKSLFHADEGKGLPIGNLTSQLFGNVYLNELDHFIKDELGIKYYGRYVDDFILIHTDKNYLIECRNKIRQYLKKELMLNLHPKKIYLQHYKKGVQFLGVYIKPHRIYAGRRVKKNFFLKIDYWNDLIETNKGNLTREEVDLFRANINSYLGLLQHFKTYNLRKKMIDEMLDNYFVEYFAIQSGFEKVIELK